MIPAWIEALSDLPFIPDTLLKMSLLLAMGWIVHFALGRRNPRWRVAVWRGVAVGVVVLPVLGLVLPEVRLGVVPAEEPEPVLVPIQRGAPRVGFAATSVVGGSGWTAVTVPVAQTPPVNKAPSIAPSRVGAVAWVRSHCAYLLSSAWAAVAVVLAVFAAKANARSRRVIRSSRPGPEWAQRMLESITRDLKCSRKIELRCSAEVCSPLLTGIFKPCIVLPESMVAGDSSEDLRGVLAHELAHLKSRDLFWSRFIQVVSILLWFHPFVWRIRGAHASACERVCDAVAADYVGNAETYSGTLARVALGLLARRRALAGIPMARKPQIRRRLEMLRRKIWASHLRRRWVVVLLLTGTIVLAGLAGLKLTRSERASAYGFAAAPPKRAPAEPGSRIVHFPQNRSLGALRVKDAGSGDKGDVLEFGRAEYEGWEYLGQAKGDVIVPAGKLLGLWVHPAASKDLSGLRRLGPNDLHIILWVSRAPEGVRPDDRCTMHLARLTGLKALMLVETDVTDNGLRPIRGLKSLTKLYLQSEKLTDAGLAHLAELSSLEILEVMSPGITDAGLAHIAKLRSLRELYIWSPKIRGPGLVHLAKLPSLMNLNLTGNHFGDAGLKYLQTLGSVKKLKLGGMLNLTDAGLANLSNCLQLRDLNLANTQITGAGLAHLSRLAKLESLNLYNTSVGDEGLTHLKPLTSLKSLNLWKTTNTSGEVTDKGLAHLREIKSLERLELSGWGITDEGLAHVAELSGLKYLTVVGRTRNPITDAGTIHLAKLNALETLGIGGAGITDLGMSHIAKLRSLKVVFLSNAPQVTNEGLAELKALKSLRSLDLGHDTGISIAGLAHLNELRDLVSLRASNVHQDNSGLNIAGLTSLEDLTLSVRRKESLRDEDLACLAKLTRLKSLQLGPHESAISDVGIKHLAGLTSLDFLNVGGRNVSDVGLAYIGNLRNLSHLRITGDFTDRGLRSLERLERLGILSITSEKAFRNAALNRLRRNLPNLQVFNVVP